MRLSHFVLVLPLLVPATRAVAQPSVAEATYYLCMEATFPAAYASKQEALCACASKAWGAKPPAIADFLIAYADAYRAQGGNTARVDQMMAQAFNLSQADAVAAALQLNGELEAAAFSCLN